MIKQFIMLEKFTNIQRAQSGLTRLFQDAEKNVSFYRVMKNDQSLGVLVPDKVWKDLIAQIDELQENFEAASSKNYLTSIERARKQKKRYSLEEIEKEFSL